MLQKMPEFVAIEKRRSSPKAAERNFDALRVHVQGMNLTAYAVQSEPAYQTFRPERPPQAIVRWRFYRAAIIVIRDWMMRRQPAPWPSDAQIESHC
jgi:hypothetical protein